MPDMPTPIHDETRTTGSRDATAAAVIEPDAIRAARVTVRALALGGDITREDLVAREEPLEIQLGPASLAVLMRTPGDDEELAAGFLVTERVVARREDVISIRHCTMATSAEAEDNAVRVHLADHVRVDLAALRRNLYASASCGICGKATIEQALAAAPPLANDDLRFDADLLAALPSRLSAAQEVFRATGGLHAAALFDANGALLVVREDVGRHNAVDKTVGWALGRGLVPLRGHGLLVSGRVSWEIVQKALAARIPLIAAVSAPTSLAVEMAEAAGIALVGFLRDGHMNVYANAQRVRGFDGDVRAKGTNHRTATVSSETAPVEPSIGEHDPGNAKAAAGDTTR